MIINVFSCPTNETIGSYNIYRSELRAKNQAKTTFASRKGVTQYEISNSFIDAEIVTDNLSKSDFYDNRLCIRVYDTAMSMAHEFPLSASYFVSKILTHCEGNKIKVELAYVPKHGIILKSSPEYITWEKEYLKEYTELGTKRPGTGLHNGKRTANKSDVMYCNGTTLIQYIGRYTVPEDITKSVVTTRSWQTSTTQAVVIPAGRYYVYVEKGLSYDSMEIKLMSSPRKLSAVVDELAKTTKSPLKNYKPEQLQPFFYDCLIGGFGRKKLYSHRGYEDIVPYVSSSSSYTRLTLKDVMLDICNQQIEMRK